jgi:hypothetical protein
MRRRVVEVLGWLLWPYTGRYVLDILQGRVTGGPAGASNETCTRAEIGLSDG